MRKILVIIASFVLIVSCSKEEPFVWDSDFDVSIMSFNLRYDTQEDGENQWDNRKEACIRMFKKTKPTVIGIQEGIYHQVSYINENLPEYKFVGVGRDDGQSGGEHCAVFYDTTKLQLDTSNNFWLSETPDYPSMGWDAECYRIVTWAKFHDREHNKSIYVFNTHFDHEGETARAESSKLLVRKIREIAGEGQTVVITGDLNMLVRDSGLKPIIDEYYSARRFADYTDNKHSCNLFGKWNLGWNIDYIFYNDIHALCFRTVAEDYGVPYISDHYPLITHFKY